MENNFKKSEMWGTCIWGIDPSGRLLVSEGIGSSTNGGFDIPWGAYKSEITEVTFFGEVSMPEASSLAGLFKDCKKVRKITIDKLHTENVVDMSSMFENCESLEELNLVNFRTKRVRNMGRMFSGCKALTNLDISSFNTDNTSNMRGMFAKCRSLYAIVLGEGFSIIGDGSTECGNLSIRDTGKYKVARVINVGSYRIIYAEGEDTGRTVERKAVGGYSYVVESAMFAPPVKEAIFKGWSLDPDGGEQIIKPGSEIGLVEEDMVLFATWIYPPRIAPLQPIREIEYGNTLPIELPKIESRNDKNVIGWMEISPKGANGTWEAITHNQILPVSKDGYLLRLCAKNEAGVAYSNPVKLKIRKASIDISKVHWVENADMNYDGKVKKVWIEGLPRGVNATYENNEGINTGTYSASVKLEYDDANYSIPIKIKDHIWSIKKAYFDMSKVRWDYEKPFDFDGIEKSVTLVGIPKGVTVTYENNKSSDAGVFTATASLHYDAKNFQKIQEIIPCVWEIRKKAIITTNLKWSSDKNFVYDGEYKGVSILNLPADAVVEYTGEREKLAGKYLARATVSGNYYLTEPAEYEWEINKAEIDMSGVSWDYEGPYTFRREEYQVGLNNIPDTVTVRYYNHIGIRAGIYDARATFTPKDPHNYITPDDISLTWTINKRVADMRSVRWDYIGPFTYDGQPKEVRLVGLPENVYAKLEQATATNAGVYVAHAVMKYDEANYEVEQPADCQWHINKVKYDISLVKWGYSKPFTYDGLEKSITLLNLPAGLNAEYTNNKATNAGQYVAAAKLVPLDPSNYETPEINGCAWSISRAKIERIDLKWTDFGEYFYDGEDKQVEIVDGINPDQVKVEYSGNVASNAGRYVATAKFTPVDTNNYEPPEDAQYYWTIKKGDFDMKKVVWNYTSPFSYDGGQKVVELQNVPKGLVVKYENASATNAGNYVATAHFEVTNPENYNPVGDMMLTWSIQKATYDLSGVKWQDERQMKYDGKTKCIELEGLPAGLKPIYRENTAINVSEYLAMVDFEYDTDNYEKPFFGGCRWTIIKTDFDTKGAKWNYEEPFVYDGTEKAVSVIDLPDGAFIEYNNSTATAAGTYIATADILAKDTENFNHTRLENLTWRIEKGNYDMSHVYWDYEKPYTYDGKEKKVVLKGLPEGVLAFYHGNSATNAGEYEATVSFKVADSLNYNIPSYKSCKWKINKTIHDVSNVRWDYSTEFTYNGKMQEVVLKGLPDGLRAIYDGNCASNAGNYTAKAILVPFDEENYYAPEIGSCNWIILKADYNMSNVKWDYNGPKTYNERSQGVALENLPNGVIPEYYDNEAVDVGTYTAKARLTLVDPMNYNIPTVNECNWEITHAEIDMSRIKWKYTDEMFTFDGEEKVVEIMNLPNGVIANYSGNRAVDAGKYVATADFTVENTNYRVPESLKCNWEILPSPCNMTGVRWNYSDEFTYDGRKHGVNLVDVPSMVVADYEDNIAVDAGSYDAKVSFKTNSNNYIAPDPMSCNWKINKANLDISSVRWDYDKPFVYDGDVKEITLAGLSSLIEVSYTENKADSVGVYNAHAHLKAVDPKNYNEPSIGDCEWEIVPTSYDLSHVRWVNDGPFIYDGTEKSVHLEGLPTGIVPIYKENKGTEVGARFAEVDFEYDEKNFAKPVVGGCRWRIDKTYYDMTQVRWNYDRPFKYNEVEREVTLVGLPEGITPNYTGNKHTVAGRYKATVEFEYDSRNYYKPKYEGLKWEIEKGEIQISPNDIRWSYTKPFTYNGEPQGVTLVERADKSNLFSRLLGKSSAIGMIGIPEGVEAIYEDNEFTDAGVYYARVTLKHKTDENYNILHLPGCRWEIRKAELDMTNVRWNYEESFVFDGEEKEVLLEGIPNGLSVTYENNKAIMAGSYDAQATFIVNDPDNIELPAPIKGCWWQIDKASYDMSKAAWAYDDTFVYSGKEKMVRVEGLPDGVKAEKYVGNVGTEVGNYTAEVQFKYRDPDNFNEPEIAPLRWRIHKKKIDTSDMYWSYNDDSLFVYDGQVKEVKLLGVPKEVEVVYVNSTKVNAGTYVARAHMTYDTKNYDMDVVPDCRWTIEKANLNTSKVYWDYKKPFVFDGMDKTVTLKNLPNEIEVRYRDNRASAIGSYTAKAYLTYSRDNYNVPAIETTLDWEIGRQSVPEAVEGLGEKEIIKELFAQDEEE